MINVYSIKEILEASDNILKFYNKDQKIQSLDDKILENEKEINKDLDIPLSLKNSDMTKNIPTEIEKIILEAENVKLKEKKKTKTPLENSGKQDLLVGNIISQKELIDDLYKTFGKKIKKNTLQLILELRKEIIHLTKNISSLKQNKKHIEDKNIKLNQNIDDLKDEENNLQNNLSHSINGFNKLNQEHKNLKLNFNKIEETILDNNKKLNESSEINIQLNNNLKRSKENFNTLYDSHKELKLNFNTIEEDIDYKKKNIHITEEINRKLENNIKNLEDQLIEYRDVELNLSSKVKKLENYIFNNNTKQDEIVNQNRNLEKNNTELKTKLDSVGHIDVYLSEINQLKLKNKDLENTIDKLKSYEDNNDQNLNIINELENKIRYYQEENIRISNQLYETNKRFDIIKSEIEVLQDQRSSLIAKINSVNDVIGNSKIVTNVFQNSQPQNTKVSISDPEIKIEKQSKDIDEEILDIFSK
jgi:chromosome segregation ATPase